MKVLRKLLILLFFILTDEVKVRMAIRYQMDSYKIPVGILFLITT